MGHYTIPNTSISVDGKFGYVFLDVPFSSEYGVKASFEYFMYGGTGADGFTFYLFDGDIDETDFRIGWPGGSLGYAQVDVQDVVPAKAYPGLKGGYIGIGFDNFMNWGSYWQGKEGGFNDPDYSLKTELNPDDSLRHYNSIAIRGPESSKYKFITGKRVNDGPDSDSVTMNIDPGYYLYPNLADIGRRFNLSSGATRVESCNQPGYRKVFFDLSPDTANPGYYRVSVSVLVNTATGGLRVEKIIDNEPYPFLAPPTLKIGFAASTGDDTNVHEIRNLAVDVAKVESLADAQAPELEFEICEDDPYTIEFLLDESQLTDPNAFIQCINLYVDGEDGFVYSNPLTWPSNRLKINNHLVDANNDPYCGMTPICNSCSETNQEKNTPLGMFTLDLPEFDEDDNDNNRTVKIQFVPNGGVSGQQKVYYTILDNYGQMSEPGVITATVNPYPKEVSVGLTDYPTCDGQADGAINDVVIGDLVAGFDYEWSWESTAGALSDLGKSGASVDFNSGTGQGVFNLTGVNLGVYTLQVWNPSDEDGCPLTVQINVDRQLGTPVEMVAEQVTVCENQPATLSPYLDPKYAPTGAAPKFKWYSNERGADEDELIDGQTFEVDGQTVTIDIDAAGVLTLSGLPAFDATTPRSYDFFVEVEAKNNLSATGAPNFCPFEGLVSAVATITVYPALQVNLNVTPDWCWTGSGAITVNALGGNGPKTFTLFDLNDIQQGSPNSTGFFPDLSPGEYYVEILTSSPDCFYSIPAEVEGPTAELVLTEVKETPATCGINNGTYTFDIQGGNLPYDFTQLQLSGGPTSGFSPVANGEITFSGLAANVNYTVSFQDAKGCLKELNFTIDEIRKPDFSIPSVSKVCADQGSITIGVSHNFYELQGVAIPDFNWYETETGSTALSNGVGPGGMSYVINHLTGELVLTSLSPGVHVLYLEMGGANSCGIPRQKVEFEIYDVPELEVQNQSDLTCGGAGNGSFQINVLNGTPSDFEYSIDGVTFLDNQGLFSGMSSGAYEVTVKNKISGCSNDIALTLTEPAELQLTLLEKTEASCEDGNGAVKLQISGGTSGYSLTANGNILSGHDLSSDGAEVELLDLSSGSYLFTVEDANGCVVDLELELSLGPQSIFEATGDIICEIDGVAVLEPVIVELGGASPVYTWYFQDAQGQAIEIHTGDKVMQADAVINSTGVLALTGLPASSDPYLLYMGVSGDKVCDQELFEVEVLVNSQPEVEFEALMPSCHGRSDGIIQVASGGGGDFTYTLSTGQSNSSGTFAGLGAGNYTVRVENASGCFRLIDQVVEQPDPLTLAAVNFENPSCNKPTGVITFSIAGGTAQYTVKVNGLPIDSFVHQVSEDQYTVTGLPPGSYSVEVADQKGCLIAPQQLFDLVNNDGFDIDSKSIQEQICQGETVVLTPSITSPPSGVLKFEWFKDGGMNQPVLSGTDPQDATLTYQISSGGVLSVDGLAIGTRQFYLRISGDGICTQLTVAEVEVFAEITADVSTSDITCFGNEDGTIILSEVSGGNGDFEFSINGIDWQGEPEFSGLSAGNYTVWVRSGENSAVCEVMLPNQEVEEPIGPIEINSQDIIRASCNLPNGSIENLALSGGWGNYTVEWRKDNAVTGELMTQGTLNGLAGIHSGNYYLNVQDEGGCSTTFEFVVEESSDPEYIIVPPINGCEGSVVEIAPVHLAPDPSSPPVAYTEVFWYKAPGKTGLIEAGLDAANPAVSYQIDATNWINPKLIISGLQPGTYTYYFFVECTGVEIPVEVIVRPIPAPQFEARRETCSGNADGKIKVIAGAEAGMTYSVNGGSWINQTQLEAQTYGPGTYTVRVQSAQACQPEPATLEIQGAEPVQLTLIDSKNAACSQPDGFITVKIAGGWAPYTLILRNQISNEVKTAVTSDFEYTFDGLSAADYQVELVDSESCATSLANPVLVEDGPTEIIVAELIEICQGETVLLAPSINPEASPRIFTWYLNAVGPSNVIVDGQVTGGATFDIQNNGSLSITGLPTGDYSYWVTVAGPQICVGDQKKIEVSVFPEPQFTASAEPEQCFGEGGALIITPIIAASNITYSLNNGPFTAYPGNRIEGLAPGEYTLAAKHGSGCTFILPTKLTIDGPAGPVKIDQISSFDATCGESSGGINIEVSGGVQPYSIVVKDQAGTVVTVGVNWNGNQGQIVGVPVGSYTVQILDISGCSSAESSPQDIDNTPTEIRVEDLKLCEGETGSLNPSVPNPTLSPSFQWFFDSGGTLPIPPGTTQKNGVTYILNSSTGRLELEGLPAANDPYRFYVSATGSGVCRDGLEEVLVSVGSVPNLRTSNPSIICDPTQSVDLTQFIEGFNPELYEYSVISPMGSNMRLEEMKKVSDSGSYLVKTKFKDGACYSVEQRILVLISKEELLASFDYSVEVSSGQFVVNQDVNIEEKIEFADSTQGDAVVWHWDFGDGATSGQQNPTHSYSQTGTYEVRLSTIDQLGCQSEFSRVIEVLDDFYVQIPNAFTPSRSDGKNNYFKPFYRGISKMEFFVFDTWGNLLFMTSDLESPGWDGRYDGVDTPNGNYVYRAEFESLGGEKISRAGVFILIR